jgi:hypothetical protein
MMIAINITSEIKRVAIAALFIVMVVCLMSCSSYKQAHYFQTSSTGTNTNISLKPMSSLVFNAGLHHVTENSNNANLSNSINRNTSKPSENVISLKFSVFGDVLKPGVYPFSSDRLTITDAITSAGELNITAIRKKILLVREIDGERKYIAINLTARNLSKSPFYYLKDNDVIYAEPGKMKYTQASNGYKAGAVVLSAVSIATIVVSAMFK